MRKFTFYLLKKEDLLAIEKAPDRTIKHVHFFCCRIFFVQIMTLIYDTLISVSSYKMKKKVFFANFFSINLFKL